MDSTSLPSDAPTVPWNEPERMAQLERIKKRSGYTQLTPWCVGYLINAAIQEGVVKVADSAEQPKHRITMKDARRLHADGRWSVTTLVYRPDGEENGESCTRYFSSADEANDFFEALLPTEQAQCRVTEEMVQRGVEALQKWSDDEDLYLNTVNAAGVRAVLEAALK